MNGSIDQYVTKRTQCFSNRRLDERFVNVLDLPIDVLQLILSYSVPTSGTDLIQMCFTCKIFYSTIVGMANTLTIIGPNVPFSNIDTLSIRGDEIIRMKHNVQCKSLYLRPNSFDDGTHTNGINRITCDTMTIAGTGGEVIIDMKRLVHIPVEFRIRWYYCNETIPISPFYKCSIVNGIIHIHSLGQDNVLETMKMLREIERL